jgi:hypothetical protein
MPVVEPVGGLVVGDDLRGLLQESAACRRSARDDA